MIFLADLAICDIDVTKFPLVHFVQRVGRFRAAFFQISDIPPRGAACFSALELTSDAPPCKQNIPEMNKCVYIHQRRRTECTERIYAPSKALATSSARITTE